MKPDRLLYPSLMMSILCVCGCSIRANKRQTISLNGTWQVAEGKMDVMPEAFEHTVPVPGLLDMATPGFETPGSTVTPAERGVPWLRGKKSDPLREAFWYRRTFAVNSPGTTVAMLKVHKACYGTCVFLFARKLLPRRTGVDLAVSPRSTKTCGADEPCVAYSHSTWFCGGVCAGASGGDSGTGRERLTS